MKTLLIDIDSIELGHKVCASIESRLRFLTAVRKRLTLAEQLEYSALSKLIQVEEREYADRVFNFACELVKRTNCIEYNPRLDE